MAQLVAVPAERVRDAAQFIEPLLKRMVSRGSGGIQPADMVARAADRQATMWLAVVNDVPVAVLFTVVETWPEGRRLRVVTAGGARMGEWLKAAWQTLHQFAVVQGCDGLVMEGRRGWGRILGIEPARYVYEKGLEP